MPPMSGMLQTVRVTSGNVCYAFSELWNAAGRFKLHHSKRRSLYPKRNTLAPYEILVVVSKAVDGTSTCFIHPLWLANSVPLFNIMLSIVVIWSAIIFAVTIQADQPQQQTCQIGVLTQSVLLQTKPFIHQYITDKVLEEAACPPPSVLVGGVCNGKNCDTIGMRCANITDITGRQFVYQPFNLSTWSADTTDGSPPVFCAANQVVVGLRCHGKHCDKVAIQCATIDIVFDNVPFQWANITLAEQIGTDQCQFTEYFHRKNYREGLDCIQGSFVRGVQCRDSFCGELSLFCCRGIAKICS